MTYNKKEILDMLSAAPIYGDEEFHEGRNNEFINSLGFDFNNNYNYAFGATKLALIPVSKEKDYVIKIPYTGSYNHESGYYSDIYHPGREDYWAYYAAECEDRPWDYCGGEVYRYAIAESEGLAECFAKTKLLGYINNYPIYIQEKCITFNECCFKHRHSIEERRRTSKCCHNYDEINEDWLTDFRLYYGEDKLIHFISFLKEFKWDDDLRNDNIGYIGNRPVLIDYSGFLD